MLLDLEVVAHRLEHAPQPELRRVAVEVRERSCREGADRGANGTGTDAERHADLVLVVTTAEHRFDGDLKVFESLVRQIESSREAVAVRPGVAHVSV